MYLFDLLVNTGGMKSSAPLLAHYRNIVRRFEAHLHDESVSRSRPLFSLVRVRHRRQLQTR